MIIHVWKSQLSSGQLDFINCHSLLSTLCSCIYLSQVKGIKLIKWVWILESSSAMCAKRLSNSATIWRSINVCIRERSLSDALTATSGSPTLGLTGIDTISLGCTLITTYSAMVAFQLFSYHTVIPEIAFSCMSYGMIPFLALNLLITLHEYFLPHH